MKYLAVFLMVFLLGCGYKPSSYYTQKVLGEKIYVDVSISRKDPKNSVIIKDALNEAVVGRFGGKLVSKDKASSYLYISIASVSFVPTVYDSDGYVIEYKTKVVLNTTYETKLNKKESFTTTGEYDFPIEANSVISDTKRFDAIRYASLDAVNEIISKISIVGMMK
ncbi:LPS assembly lipoprotein LptE [Sulfurospirillum sp. 1612]|uniref:LPS assembly lipoprotein LptE n=1 Tax=Sulfurospirillum sp. 1612 TaxID=3094835 RepID=UPI002F959CC3